MTTYPINSINSLEQDQDLLETSNVSNAAQIAAITTMRAAMITQEILVSISTMRVDPKQASGSLENVADSQNAPMMGAAMQTDPDWFVNDLPDWFTPDVPDTNLNPYNYPGNDLFTKLYRMVMYMKQHPDDINAAYVFYKFLQNLSAQGLLDGNTDASKQIINMLNGLTGADGKTPIYLSLIKLLSQYNFFETQNLPDRNDVSFLNDLQFGGNNSIANAVNEYIANVESGNSEAEGWSWGSFWDASVINNTRIFSADEWNWVAGGAWGTDIQDPNVSQWCRGMRTYMVDFLMQDPTLKNNAYILVMILLFMLNDSSSSDEISGFGSMGKFFSDRTKDASDLVDLWKQGSGTTDPDAGFDFMKNLEDLRFKIDNSPFVSKDLKDSFDTQVEGIENMNFCDSKGGTVTYLDEYLAAKNGDSQAKTDLDANYKLVCSDSTCPGYSTIDYGLKTLSGFLTDQSQTQTTELTQLTNSSQANLNMFNKSMNGDSGIIGLLNQLVHNQTPS